MKGIGEMSLPRLQARGWTVVGLWAVGLGFVPPASAGGRIALTFDDGPCPFFTPRALDLLDQYGAKATFFYVGQRLARAPHLAQMVAARGHEIENHTFSHKNLNQLTPSQVCDQILWTCRLVERQTGVRPRYVRPPYNALNEATREIGRRLGVKFVQWTIDPRDWQKQRTSNQIVRHVMDHVQEGSVVLLHETRQTLQALPDLLEQLRRAGFQSVTLAELWGETSRQGPAPRRRVAPPPVPPASSPFGPPPPSLGLARPPRPVVKIYCGKGGWDEAGLASGYRYELVVGSRSDRGGAGSLDGPPSWAWQGKGEVQFHLQVPPGIEGALSLYLRQDPWAWDCQELLVNHRPRGKFWGSRWVHTVLDKSLTAAGTLLVRVVGSRATVRICEVVLEVWEGFRWAAVLPPPEKSQVRPKAQTKKLL